jgi:uncharacterized LabA/DUF88 family protein
MEIKDKTIALLIDADNISNEYFEILIDELNKLGNVTYRRIYGDFTSTRANGWRPYLIKYGIEPMQQYPNIAGKNATDSAMIIDAMDIMYTGKVDCFCLATSDSDFTKLAMRFRNANITVIGAGETKTPLSFRTVCHNFLAMDTLLANAKQTSPTSKDKIRKNVLIENPEGVLSISELIELVRKIIISLDDGEGWVNFGTMCQNLYKKDNAFSPMNYGKSTSLPNFFNTLPNKPFRVEIGRGFQRICINNKTV